MKKFFFSFITIFILQLFLNPVFANEINNSVKLNGVDISAFWAIPFVGLILSIAIFPLILPRFWSKHYGKITLIWSLIVLIGLGINQGFGVSLHSFIEVMFEQYLPFIFLLTSLFTITGGIRVKGSLAGSPQVNVLILLIGAVLSSWLGTTGAAILLIRPLINANNWRKYKVHTMIFFIFIAGNIGGSLTPVGNPPLLMGFISKVPFFWPTIKLLLPTLLSSTILLVIYFIIDTYLYKKENKKPELIKNEPIRIEGAHNFILLACVIGAVLISSFNWGNAFVLYHVEVPLSIIIEMLLLAVISFVAFKTTRADIRVSNHFTWHPIIEVGKIFAGIFICMAPLIAMLRAGTDGPMNFIINSLSDSQGQPINAMYYWLSGGLSAFLDSAPAYLVFFNTAASPAISMNMLPHEYMTTILPNTLLAITAGASFMGAITYIGNAPNMMVKSIAEENGIKMPSFFGYMLWSVLILVPLFILIQFLFI